MWSWTGIVIFVCYIQIPGPSGRHNEPRYLRTPRVVKPGHISAQKRYEIFCNEVKIADCQTSQVLFP